VRQPCTARNQSPLALAARHGRASVPDGDRRAVFQAGPVRRARRLCSTRRRTGSKGRRPGRTAEQRTHLGGAPMTVANRRRSGDRRVKDVPVTIERRSGLDRRMIVESATAQIHAVLELLTQLADQGALRDDSRRLLATAGQLLSISTLPGLEGIYANKQLDYYMLHESVPAIRADAVHVAGITGKGIGVAILDSGIDGAYNADVAYPQYTVQNVKVLA